MKKRFKDLWSNKFYQGGIFLTVSSLIISLLNYFFNFLAGRSLGPQGFGEITTLFSYLYIFSVPISVFSTLIIQKVGNKEKEGLAFTKSLEIWFFEKIKKWWFLIILVLFITPFTPRITNLSPAVALALFPIAIISFLGSFYSSIIQGLCLFFWFSVINTLGALLKLTGPILTTIGIDGLSTIIAFLILSGIITLIIFYIITHNIIKKENPIQLKKLENRLIHIIFTPHVLITVASILALTLINNIDVIFVKKFLSATNAGIYSSWSLFAKIILYIVGPGISVSFVFFTKSKNTDKQNKLLIISLALLILFGLGSYIAYNFFGAQIVNLLFGSKFLKVVPMLGQASIFGSFYTAILFINNYFIARRSPYALILPVLIPFYILSLFFIQKQLQSIIHLNIIFAVIATVIYILFYLKTLLRQLRQPKS